VALAAFGGVIYFFAVVLGRSDVKVRTGVLEILQPRAVVRLSA